MAACNRYFLYSQHMAGTGHFVRTSEIAKALGHDGQVYLVDGGRPVPRDVASDRIQLVLLPRICREGRRVLPVDAADSLDDIMARRERVLLAAMEQIKPDLLMIEHFPLRRWELRAEVLTLVRKARALRPGVKVVCSLRDIPGRSSYEPDLDRYASAVLDLLHTHFDQVLIHADPQIIRLDEQIDWAHRIEIPLAYTGYVSQKHRRDQGAINAPADVIVSAGGTGSTALLSCAIKAWKLLATRSAIGKGTMALFLSLSATDEDRHQLEQQAAGWPIRVLPYTTNFLGWLRQAELSISNAGYNTCTNLLEMQIRSILVPNRSMSDQVLRCERFERFGLAKTLEMADLTAERLAEAILERLADPALQHNVRLDGAEFTRGCVQHLLGTAQVHQFRLPGQLADTSGRAPGRLAG